jgi:transposase
MPSAISARRRGHVKVKVELGEKPGDIQAQTKVSLRSVYRFKENILEYGTCRPPKKDVQGRPRKITPEMERVCPLYNYFLISKN